MNEFTQLDELSELHSLIPVHITTSPVPVETIRNWLNSLLTDLNITSLTPSTSNLEQIEKDSQELLLFAYGITTTTDQTNEQNLNGSELQKEQSLENNRLLHQQPPHNEPILAIYSRFLQVILLAHRTQVTELYPSSIATSPPDETSDAPSSSPNSNPHDLFTKSTTYQLTSKLLRRILTLLQLLIQANRTDMMFMFSVVQESYLLNLLFESLSLVPAPLTSLEVDDVGEVDDSDEFIVEYSEIKNPSLKKSLSSPRALKSAKTPINKGVDPSATFTNAFWKKEASQSFAADVCMQDISSVSFVPLMKILPLIQLILDATQALIQTTLPSTLNTSLPLAPTTQAHLYPFQLQELCAILSTIHGPILYTPELIDKKDSSPVSPLVNSPSSQYQALFPGTADHHQSPLFKFTTTPITKDFPFLVTSQVSEDVKRQLSALAKYVLPSNGTPFQSPLLTTLATNEEESNATNVTAERIYALVLPYLKRYIHSLSKILLVVTPGFDLNRVVQDGHALNAAPTDGSDQDTIELDLLHPTYIDLRQQLLHANSLTSEEDTPNSMAFALRRVKEVVLDSSVNILLQLRHIFSLLPDPTSSGDMLALRYWQQLLSETNLPLILTKLLNQDLEKSLQRHTEGEGTKEALNMWRGDGQTWLKQVELLKSSSSAPSAANLTIQTGLSHRLLHAFASIATLLHLSLDEPSSSSTLLYSIPLLKVGIPKLLAQCFTKFFGEKTSPLEKLLKTSDDQALYQQLKERLALTWRTFQSLMTISGADKKSSEETTIRTFLTTHPSHTFHQSYMQLLYGLSISPLHHLSHELTTSGGGGLSAYYDDTTELLLHEIGLTARRRFPYGECAPVAPPPSANAAARSGTPSSALMMPSASPTNVAPNEPMTPGLGLGFLFQPTTPKFVSILQQQFIRVQLGLPTLHPVADALIQTQTFNKSYEVAGDPLPHVRLATDEPSQPSSGVRIPAVSSPSTTNSSKLSFESARLLDEKWMKLDRILSLEGRTGDHQSHLTPAYDFFVTSLGPSNIINHEPKKLTLFHYLLLLDFQRKLQTESYHFIWFQIEFSLEQPDLSHQPIPTKRIRLRRAILEKRAKEEQQYEKFMCTSLAAFRKQVIEGGASDSGSGEVTDGIVNDDGQTSGLGTAASPAAINFFAHPFLPTTMSLDAYDLLVRTSSSPTTTTTVQSKLPTLLQGRVELSEEELQQGYAELIASGNYD